MNPSICVAIPTCNGARHLRAMLTSLLNTGAADQLLVVDDRSSDDTLAIVQALAGDRARIEVNTERLGLAGNWNRCFALSEAPIVSIFHQDDLMLPGHLETHAEAYLRNPDLGWVASDAQVIDDAGLFVADSVVEHGGLGGQDRYFDGGAAMKDLVIGNPLRCSAVTINRSAHAEVGGFDPSYRYVVDWHFWLRVAAVRPVAWRARTTAAIRWHPASETHRFATGTADLDETARLLDQMGELMGKLTWAEQRSSRHGDRRLARAFLNRAHIAFKRGDPALARHALTRALRLAPRRTSLGLACDPRLLGQLAIAILLPGWVARRRTSGGPTT